MVKLGGDELLATDSPYADIDDDERPIWPSDAFLQTRPSKPNKYSSARSLTSDNIDFGLWRRDVRIVAGVGGFGRAG